jgi:3-oxoacyl-[acyl-carrier protein] reductase
MIMSSLKGKVCIVTGASRGIGAATIKLFAEAGADVVLNFRRSHEKAEEVAAAVRELGSRAILHQGNVGESRVAQQLVDRTLAEFGRIDIVVNNAGIWTYGEIGSLPEEVWDETIEVNLKGTFNVCNAVVPHLRQQGGGKIINISSTAGQRGEAFHSHYAASKGAVIAFTKSLAVELAPYNILVNSVAPGWVDTDMNTEVFADAQFRKQAVDAIPLKRIATAEDTAGAVFFLASDLSKHITGATINVNGGSVLV